MSSAKSWAQKLAASNSSSSTPAAAAARPAAPAPAAPASAIVDDLPVDQQIRSGKGSASPADRKLEKFFQAEGAQALDFHADLESQGQTKKFNQLQTLEKMTGRKGGFNMEDYSTKLDTSGAEYQERLKMAEALEADIQGSKPRNLRQAIDRGAIIKDLDDDQLFSAVQRSASGGSGSGYVPPHRRDASPQPEPAAAESSPPAPPKAEPASTAVAPPPAATAAAAAAVVAQPKEEGKQQPEDAQPEPKDGEKSQQPAAAAEKPKTKLALKSALRADAAEFVPRNFVPPGAVRPAQPAPQPQQGMGHPRQAVHMQAPVPQPYNAMQPLPLPHQPQLVQAFYQPVPGPPPAAGFIVQGRAGPPFMQPPMYHPGPPHPRVPPLGNPGADHGRYAPPPMAGFYPPYQQQPPR